MRIISRKTTKKEEIQAMTDSGHNVSILFERRVGQPVGTIEASTSVPNNPEAEEPAPVENPMPGMYNAQPGNSTITFIKVTRPATGEPSFSANGKLDASVVGNIVAEIQAALEEYANEVEA